MPRKQKKYHFIYKTTNLITNKFYVGMHSTDDLEDGYFGSGKIIHYSVNKHGIENHKVEILEFLSSRDELKKREAEIVNEALLADPLNMNLKFGGNGGWDHTKDMDLAARNVKCNQKFIERYGNDKAFKVEFDNKCGENLKAGRAKRKELHGSANFGFGRKLDDETKRKIAEKNSQNQTGIGNSQFGTCWICDGVEAKKIKKNDIQSWLDQGWRKGRK